MPLEAVKNLKFKVALDCFNQTVVGLQSVILNRHICIPFDKAGVSVSLYFVIFCWAKRLLTVALSLTRQLWQHYPSLWIHFPFLLPSTARQGKYICQVIYTSSVTLKMGWIIFTVQRAKTPELVSSSIESHFSHMICSVSSGSLVSNISDSTVGSSRMLPQVVYSLLLSSDFYLIAIIKTLNKVTNKLKLTVHYNRTPWLAVFPTSSQTVFDVCLCVEPVSKSISAWANFTSAPSLQSASLPSPHLYFGFALKF